jgi:hypothetical protein
MEDAFGTIMEFSVALATIMAVQIGNVAGVFGPSSAGPIMASLVWLLFFSALLFVRMLVQRPTPPVWRAS